MTDSRIDALVDRALDYRGFVTLRRRDGSSVTGYVYDRGPRHVELFDERVTQRMRLSLDELADVALSGDDVAARAHEIWERRQGKLEPRETSTWGDWPDGPALIVVALPQELRAIARVLGARLHGDSATGQLGDRSAVAVAVGPGGQAASAIADRKPGLVIGCGYAGALDPWLRPGDVVVASSVRGASGDSLEAGERALHAARHAFGAWPRMSEGEIVCPARVALTRDDKRALAQPGRLAVDLESYATARAAHDAGVPWLVVRVILDSIDTDLPAFTRESHASYTLPALRHALGSPREIVRLAWQERIARRSLAAALERLAPVVGGIRRQEDER